MKKNNSPFFVLVFALFITSITTYAQDDLLNLVEEPKTNEKVFATFKAIKIINAQTIETVKGKTLDFRITHRFGNIGVASNGGSHTLWGFDNSEDIRFSFDYGLTNNLTIGVGRSKRNENIDGSVKYRFLEQTQNSTIPLSIALYACAAVNAQSKSQFYSDASLVKEIKTAHRLSYVSQLIIARKFSSAFSLELLPTYVHRNLVRAYINSENNAEETNDLFSFGLAGRIKLSKRVAIIADYFYTFSEFRKNNPLTPFYAPLGVGIEIETGGHVFNLSLTNAAGIIENSFIPYTNDTWTKGGYKFGFNISRVFGF